MQKISQLGSYLKRVYRIYANQILDELQVNGFLDLRPSFLEILMYICEFEASSIKEIGRACGLKKQTMTSHLNELEKRGYITRKTSERDRREQLVVLTEYGEKFRFTLQKVLDQKEKDFTDRLGEVELNRAILMLENMHSKIQISNSNSSQQILI